MRTLSLLLKLMLLGLSLTISVPASAERLKDITSIAGVRNNQLVGYGLVVGLDGTGDKTAQTPFTTQAFKNMLNEFGIRLPPDEKLKLKNVAAVSIHAELPPFTRPGQAIDITVSSIGNSSSLRGGSLLMAPLKGADGRVYAVAQGNLVVGGLGVEGADGSSVTVNVPSVGRIPNGAMVERAVPSGFNHGEHLTFQLDRPDFTTARRIVDALNEFLGPGTARALDAGAIEVRAPKDSSQRVNYMSVLENVEVDPGDAPARVVINSRTGTIVIGKHVRVEAVAVTHGSMIVSITEDYDVSQPAPFARRGETVVTPDSGIDVTEGDGHMFQFPAGVSLDDIVRAVNQVGAAPGDLMAILEALKEAGALKADLIVI